MIEERPEWAQHVVAQYTERTTDVDGLPDPQKIVMKCEKCEAVHRVWCTSGAVRSHIHNFAVVHLHRDPLEVKR